MVVMDAPDLLKSLASELTSGNGWTELFVSRVKKATDNIMKDNYERFMKDN